MAESEVATTFSKGLRVLACFESRQRYFTMAELARLTGFDRATTRRLCLSLISSGYLHKADQKLCLTPKILSVAGGFLGANDIGLSVQPIMDQFANTLNSEISLVIRDGLRAIYIANAKVEGSRVSLGFTVGSTLPLLHTAVGRMILGSCSCDNVVKLLGQLEPNKFTAKTEINPESIRNKISEASQRGFAYVEDEFEMGAAGIAVPVGKLSGNEAVLGVTHSSNKLRQTQEQEITLDVLRQTAQALRRLSIFAH